MPIRRPLHRSDGNRNIIVKALRDVGVKVYDLGEPVDLMVGYRRRIVLMEVKDGARKPSERRLRPAQQAFFDEWSEFPVFKVETLNDAFQALGIEVQ